MKKWITPAFLLSILLSSLILISCHAGIKPGQTAPNFSAQTATGETITLDQYRGKIIVLEWFNAQCPFVGKMYSSGKMQELQKEFSERGVIWLRVISSAKDKQGHMTAEQIEQADQTMGAAPSATIIDHNGSIDRLYDAKTTPEMYIINQKGTLVYMGAIDNKPSTSPASINDGTNYVEQNLRRLINDKPVMIKQSKPYGCSIKY